MKINVIVVPEKRTFIEDTTYGREIYINKKNGIPRLKGNNAKYVAPFWLDEKPQGVDRIYHIKNVYETTDCTVMVLGNSFIIEPVWSNMGNHRKFEYHDLASFSMVEIKDGILMQYF